VRQEVIFQVTMGDEFSWGLMGIQGIKQANSVGVSIGFLVVQWLISWDSRVVSW